MRQTPETEQLVKIAEKRLKPSRFDHTERTLDLALTLSEIYGVDKKSAETAAILHDFAKDSSVEGNDLSHGSEAALLAESEFGVENIDVLNAIRYHTTGRACMSDLELVIFLADTLEEGRVYESADRLRNSVKEDLYSGALTVIKELIEFLENKGISPSQDSLDAVAWLEVFVADK